MPGPKGNRTKGNVKPSSSSRAAELLSQSGSSGFIGFGSPGGAQAYVPASQAFDDVDSCLDSDFRVVLRKLTKRDATTKIKALGEFSSLCKEKDDATLQAVLPFWPRLYNKLAIDVDSKVRECTQNGMATLVSRVRRNLAPYLKNVMGAWILSRNDTYPTVSSAANRSFCAAFPPEKQENAIVFCKQAVLEHMIDNLLNQTPSTLSDPKTTEKEEMEAKYVRVLASSLMGLRQLLQALPAAQLDDSLKGHLQGLLNVGKFWNLSKSQVPSVRSGLFWFLGSVCQVVPDLAAEFVGKISPLVLGNIDLLEPGLTAAVWDAVLSLVKFVPACWENINWQKAFWPKLRKVLENGCQGNAASVAPCLLPLFSCVPMDTAGGAASFFPKVLDLFKEGFAKDCVTISPSETNAWAKAFLECLLFSFKQIGTEESSGDILQSVLLDQLLPVVEASLFDLKPTLSRSHLFTFVSSFLRTVASNTDTSGLMAIFWCRLSNDVVQRFEIVGSGEKQSLHPDRIVLFVKALLHPQGTSNPSSSKSGHVRFAAKESRHQQSGPTSVAVELSDNVKSFVKEVVVHSHILYRKDRQHVHLKLFVDLANLYFPADIATYVLHSLEADTEDGTEERTRDTGEGRADTGENIADAHSKVIDQVVLPVLGEREWRETNENIVDDTITLLFACLPYLSEKSSTEVWDNVLQTVHSSGALCSLIQSALDKRRIMPQVSDWLSSSRLHTRICDFVALVTTRHSTLPPEELEQGWRVICLVLSANDDNEPVFPSSWIVDIVSSVHQELVTLASHTLAQQDIQVAVQFVAKAALTFFQNLKMSLCMDERRDVLVALLTTDVDCSLPTSGEAGSVLRQSWTTGLGLAVQETGGFLKEGGVLSSACHILRDTLLTKTHTMQQYKLVVEVTEELLKTVQDHLPWGEDVSDNSEAYNPIMVALLSELMVPVPATVTDSDKIIQYHCLTGQLPITVLNDLPATEADYSSSMEAVVFSSLYNLHLLQCLQRGFRFGEGADDGGKYDGVEAREWEGQEEQVLLTAVRSLLLATSWSRLEAQIGPDIVSALENLTETAHAHFSSASKSFQQKVLCKAFNSIKDDIVSALIFTHLADLQSARDRKIDKEYFQQLYSSDESQNAQCTEVIASYLPQWMAADVFQLQAAIFTSVTSDTDSLPSLVSCLRLMGTILSKEPAFISETYQDILLGIVTKLKSMRDDDSALFLFSCDIPEEPVSRVAFNMSVMQFLTMVVNSGVFRLMPDHWDFILCSIVSWIESVDSSSMSLHSPVSIQTFGVEACRLVAALADTIQHRVTEGEAIYPPNVKTEWTEFFAEGIYAFLFPLFVKLVDQLKKTNKKGEAVIILSAVGSAMSQCPQEQVIGHHLPLNLVASDDTSPIPESLQTLLNYLCPMLTCVSAPAQVTAYTVLDRIITLLPSYHKEQEAAASATEKLESRQPPAVLMKAIEDCATAMDVVLAPVAIETTITMVPGTEEYQFALGYLLAWQLLLHLFHSADSAGRAEYAAYLKEHSNVQHLLTHLFRLMPHSPGGGSGTPSLSKSTSEASPMRPSLFDDEDDRSSSRPVKRSNEDSSESSWFSSSDISLTPVGVGHKNDIARVSCTVYLHCLEVIPVLVRQWWKDQDRKSAAYIDKFTAKYVSQQRIKSEMHTVNSSDSSIQDLVVKANSITRQVTASYTAEELKAEIKVTLPENYPLGEITVGADRHAVVKLAQWDRLLLQISVFLQHQNGSILEGFRLWKRNIDKKLEGVEECFICYAVIHATSMDLPRLPCGTCKKKFHRSCLYKWLNSSQNPTCPMCRSIIV